MADIIPLELSFNETGGDATFHGSLSYTPPPNKLILLVDYQVQLLTTPPPTVPLCDGNGVNWTPVLTQLFDHGGVDRALITVYRGLTSSPTTGVTTTSYTRAFLRCAKTIFQFSNVDIGNLGADAIAQTKQAKILADVTQTPSVTLDNPEEDQANSVLGICGYGDTDTAQNPGVVQGLGFELLRNNPTVETGGQAIEFRQRLQQLVDWNMSSADFDWAAIAIELRNAIPFVEGVAPAVGGSAFIDGNLIRG